MVEEFLNAFQRKYGSVSKNWKHWFAYLDLKTCEECRKMHGKIYSNDGLIFATYDHYKTFAVMREAEEKYHEITIMEKD